MATPTTFKNTPMVSRIMYGVGAYAQLGDLVHERRKLKNNVAVLFIVDDFFEGKEDILKIPTLRGDKLVWVYTGGKEPKTEQVDDIRDATLKEIGEPCAVIGIGGGSALDIAKAVAVMLTHEGKSEKYQGLNLAYKPSVYHIGVPTISGTAAECSMTAVLSGPEKKLGIKYHDTPFHQIILDAALTYTVPNDQWFYTAMDTFIHSIESKSGQYKNIFSMSFEHEALRLCDEVFIKAEVANCRNQENSEKLMVASILGGLSLTYSEVGVCHAMSYGLAVVLGMRHCYANCVIFQHLEDYYGDAVNTFKKMVQKHKVPLPIGLSKNWSAQQITAMADVCWNLPHMWRHALGDDWEAKITKKDMQALFRRL